jgi:2-polyprenyl-6-methoxyphenol hydroxylase-like FAD-dependent oxidoreductase
MQRTAELLRLWGAEDEVRQRGVPRASSASAWCGPRRSPVRSSAGPRRGEPDDKAPEPQSPATGLRCPQDDTESALRGRAETHDIADLHYGFEMTRFEQDDA